MPSPATSFSSARFFSSLSFSFLRPDSKSPRQTILLSSGFYFLFSASARLIRLVFILFSLRISLRRSVCRSTCPFGKPSFSGVIGAFSARLSPSLITFDFTISIISFSIYACQVFGPFKHAVFFDIFFMNPLYFLS